MRKHTVKIKFVTDYLQARFTDDAKKELTNLVSKGIIKSEEDSWKVFLHEDEEGVYIPNLQVRNCLINGGKELKLKKQRRSLSPWVISNVIVSPDKIRLGKKAPDEILVSYPARKDGNRVTTKHPVFKAGLEVEFDINILDDEMELKAIKDLIMLAGKNYGLGARRRDMFGRFELVSLS